MKDLKDEAKGERNMKKLSILLSVIIVLTAVCLAGCVIKPVNDEKTLEEKSSAVFTLDVNPGVRVYVDEDNIVIGLEATNEDGEEIVEEINFENIDYEAVVEEIIDKLEEKGYLEEETNSILVSMEKKEIEISEKINEKINKAFEKHGKQAAIIEQELDELNKEIKATIDEIAKEHDISKGKAHIIEKIREEKPELSEEELAKLRVDELAVMLNDTSEHIKEHFKGFEDISVEKFIEKEEALTLALESLELTIDEITLEMIKITREDGKMAYEVELVCGEKEYEIVIDAESGIIISTEEEEYEEIKPDEIIGDFCEKHQIDRDKFQEHIKDFIGKDFEFEFDFDFEELLTKGEALDIVIEELEIALDDLEKTKVEIHEAEDGMVYEVEIKTESGNTYKAIIEAYTGVVIKTVVNGVEIDASLNIGDE